jgi:acyl transferase domain-containing protein/enoyl-CoA hydratase/carnithine racemase/SAM-dependent methyltransferase
MKELSGDIAVIGMACRFPGAADPEQYWENLVAGRVSIGEVPETRWRWQDYRDESQPEGSSPYCRWAGLIDDVDAFDAAFFNVSPREAESLDPQQRLGLELAWSCFEDAGMRPSHLSGQNVGVFLGFTNLDYKEIMEESPIDIYYATGTLSSVIPNRISYHFNLRGPSVAVDTACSSSLHALHLACRALRENECDAALAGGISLLLTPKRFIWYGKAGILSSTGAIRAFDEDANGTVRGEGAGFLLLKPLERAIADGNRIVGVIKGTAVNHGGKHHTLTYPSSGAQAEVIAGALRAARVTPAEVSYVEGHGTGTFKGDPIEVQGLLKAFQSDAGKALHENGDAWCGLGTVKPNIGHLEGAAGIAGVIKVLQALRHKTLPPSVNLTKVNPRINLGGAIYFVDRLQPWEPRVRDGVQLPRVAGVSSFGFAGTNAHVVVAEAPIQQEEVTSTAPAPDGRAMVILSAKDTERLKDRVRQLQQTITRRGLRDSDLAGIAYTLQVGREPMEERLGLLVSSVGQLGESLQAFLENKATPGLHRGHARKSGELVTMLADDEVFGGAVEKWVEQGRLEMLLELWLKGLDLDWSKLYGGAKPQPIALPTYPFARTRYWAEAAAVSRVAANGAAAALHPLLHNNTSNLAGQRYGTTFTGAEFFLADHQVIAGHGTAQKVLPGVTCLEMARAAIQEASADWPEAAVLELRDTVWTRPIFVNAETRVNIGLLPADDDQIDYEIYTGEGDEEIVACQGRAVFSPPSAPVRIDMPELAARMGRGALDASTVDATFVRMGMAYGPAFRTITAVHRGNGELLANLRLPDSVVNTGTTYVLHPSLMDGALQAAVLLNENGEAEPRVPFALERLRVLSPCSPEMVAWARYAPGSKATDNLVKVDVDLCNELGDVCVQLHGFSSRVLASPVNATTGSLVAAPVWQTTAVSSGSGRIDYAEHHAILCELPAAVAEDLSGLISPAQCLSLRADGQKNIAAQYGDHAVACFERIKDILQRKPEGKVLVQIVIPDHEEQAILSGLSALLKTARLENPRLIGQIILVPAGVTAVKLGRHLQDEKSSGLDTVIRFADGVRQVLRWEEIALDRENVPSAFNAHGVYLITGGLGGLGILFAKEILARSPKARVVLTGRAELTSEKRASLEALFTSGNRPSYHQLDLSDREQVRQLIEAIIGEHGKLSGILHCAGMIADHFIVKKTAGEFRQVLAPKVTGASHLDLATRDVQLDFFLLFSSFAGAMGNLGQADYASANGFLDQFAAYRNRQVARGERHGRTLSINWPLWQAGGMGIDAAGRELLERTTGIQPMATATGIDAFYGSVASSYDQILVAEGDLTRIRRALFAAPAAPSEPEAESLPVTAAIDSATFAEKTQDFLRKELSAVLKLPAHNIDPQAALETYGIDSVLAMKLTNQLERTFGSLSKTLFFEYQTVGALSQYFLRSHADRLAALFVPKNDGGRSPKAVAVPNASSQEVPASRKPGRRSVPPHSPSVSRADSDPIAIIGLSGRYPEAVDVDAYWRNLRDGKDCIVEVPKERWDWREYFTEDRAESGRHYSKWGGFIEGVDEFDPLFFNISPKEAKYLDPQERLFLQHAWMAVEDAGYTRASLEMPAEHDLPGQIGVYAGVMYTEYQLLGAEASERGHRMGMAGSAASIANRVSYALNLHGPSVTLDTMCSSSLTAIHFACEDLRRGRTAMAIAGGVNVSIHPNKYLLLSAGQFISSDGHCQSFGEGGDGYIPGEGVGVVVLKRLSEAEKDGDHVYGVIRGSALNHGGKTNGYTVPNPQAQASAISRALADSQIDARHISYIEAHGTGTKLGDPIEIAALNKAFAHYTNDTQFCLIGSAKSNIGHCESAAGMAGLTKVLLQMQHQQIVPSLHSAQLNPHVDFDASPFIVNQILRPWEQPVVGGRTLPRIAGISSFGAGGSNAHLIVEEYQGPASQPIASADVAIVLSARTAVQLQQKVRDLADFIRPRLDTIDLHALAYTLQTGREAMDERVGFVASSMGHLAETLQAYVEGTQNIDGLHQGRVKRDKRSVSLLSTDTDFRQTIDKWIADGKLAKLLELWVEGVELDWRKLYGDTTPQRISLPVYPFAKERYWIDVPPAKAAATAVLHPLLHTNTSDFSQQSYSSTFSGEEFFLNDQDGPGPRMFPVTAYLEMARAAIRNAARSSEDECVELRDVVCEQPAIVTPKTQVSIALTADGKNEIDFEIFSPGSDDDVVHCRGRAGLSRQPALPALDLRRLRADNQVLVDLQLPKTLRDSSADYVLHPFLLHDALQAGGALIDGMSGGLSASGVTRLPLALDSLRVISQCSGEMVAWVRYSPGLRAADGMIKLDIDLCDARGNVSAEVRGAGWQRSAVETVVRAVKETPIASVSRREIAVATHQHAMPAATERRKPAGISLGTPGAPASSASNPSNRAPVTLPTVIAGLGAVPPVRLFDEANGIFSIQIKVTNDDPPKDVIASLLRALELVQQEASVKALKVVGLDRCFRRGGREDYNDALEQGLYRAIVSFPYPIIAVLHGDTAGAAFLCAALCDFLVCNEDAIYRYTDAERQFCPTTAEALLFGERFGEVPAQDFLYVATASPGKQLRAKGWTFPIVPASHIEAATQRLVAALTTKSQETLRLLKQHLTRHLGNFVDALRRVDALAPVSGTVATPPIDSPSAHVQLTTPIENVLLITFDPVSVNELVAALSDVFAKAHEADAHRGIVLVSTRPEFLPEVIGEDAVLELRRLLIGAAIPVVAALTGNARGDAWLISQFCDASVYGAAGMYSAARIAPTAAPIFARRLGSTAAKEIFFTGADYSGMDLRERTGTLIVAEHDQVVSAALKVAESWSKLPRATLASWKKQTLSTLPALQGAASSQADEVSETLPAVPTPITLRSKVVKATAHPEGIVVVRLEDRDAKNMFSEAFMAGVSEVFAHIAETPAYKVVILTGYDQYFACGATQELLFAIHEGRIKFTDYNIYQLPLDCQVPVISAMQGHGIGAGWTLGMFGDLVLLSEESRYVNPYMDYGFTPGDGATWVFAQRVGHDLANESHLTAQHYTGGELKERGLRLPVLPQAEVLPAAMALARRIAQVPRDRLAGIKSELTRHAAEELQETYRLEVDLHDRTFVGRPDTLARILNNFHRPAAAVADGMRQTPLQDVGTNGTDALASVTASLKTLLANELQMQERDADENLQFVDLGLDSVAGVSWVRKINEMYQTSIEAASIYGYPTLARFSRYVKEEAERRGTLRQLAPPALTTVAVGDALGAVTASLKALLADELQMQESDVDENRQFVDIGLDSVAGVSWIRKINEKYQTSIDAANIYSHPTLARLSRYVTTEAETYGVLSRPVQAFEMRAVVENRTLAHNPVAARPTLQTRVARRSRPASRFASSASTRPTSGPIAVIGMAGQFPEASNLEEFWQNIAQGRNCISQVPPHRWDVNAYYQPGDAVEGKTICNWLGALADYDRFDPLFFNISPTEAESMDPQQRLFLQACWHSIENAGYDARSLSGTKCGVFAGCAYGDYHLLSREQQLSAQGWTGDVTSILAARISYHLNLQGPCLSIDTACSSSLVALAQACDSIIAGGSDLALAGGVYVMAGPEALIRATQSGMLSPAGRCFTFDQRADGFVPGEGVGVVLLKRLADAERDHDIIHAVIQGWGVNQDGKTNGITAPNPESQIHLEQEVYDRYGIDPAHIQLVEVHGTGTKLGDPIEVLALKQAFKKYTQEKDYCALGSVKSNIGHCSMAAGIAGFLKAVLALKHRQLPPTINFERLNEHIDLGGSPFYVNTRLQAWEPNAVMRQAAVSSFGFSGTNAHVVVGEYQPPVETSFSAAVGRQDGNVIVPLSARRPEQLKQKARDLLAFLRDETSSVDLLEIAYTLQMGREPMDIRVAFLVSTVEQLTRVIEAYVEGKAGVQDVYEGQVKRGQESTDLLRQDAETREAVVAQWIAQKRFSKVIDWWVKGVELDWNRFYGELKPRRIALPGYPFAKERYWIDVQSGRHPAASAGATAILHPLLHGNTSDPGERRYSSTFSGEEFFLADHHIKGEEVLPGVAYLEMVYAAVGHAFPAWRQSGTLELRNTVWMQPFVVTGDRQVSVALLTDGDEVDFEIYSRDGEDEIIHCQGRAVLSGDPAPRLDLEQLGRTMDRGSLEPDRVYSAFARLGGVYGRSFQAITAIDQGSGQFLARLRLPEAVEHTLADYVLHPSLMDAALHGYPVLMEGWPDSNQPRMPFAVESVRVIAACTREMAAWVRYAPGNKAADTVVKLDVDLCDAGGNVCVQMHGFSTRILLRDELTTAPAVASGSMLVAPSAVPANQPVALAAIDPRSLTESAQDYLCRQLSGILKLTAHTIDPQAPLATYGIDSILAMKLTNRLETTFGSLPKTLFFEYQTIRELTEYFVAAHSERLAALLAPSVSGGSEMTAQAVDAPPAEPVARRRSMRRRNAAPAATGETDPIAIIGLSGRYPEAWDIDAFWRNLQEGKDCIIEVPGERWDWREYYSDDRSETGRHYSKWGGFIAGVDEFDPLFFNISPREAKYIDPQERLFLQHAWMAVEDAGYTRASLRISQGQGLPGQVGVYAGVWSNEYQLFGAETSMQGERMGFAISTASIANRVSYVLNLHGPSMTVDTMCSASLTGIHLACQDLRLGRINLAIAGGVNVNIHPNKYLMLSAAQAISTDGHCRSFGEGGDGYIPAEGVGVVVLKRLSEAERDGDHIYGIIRGSALNHGGRTNGYTVPNPHAQTDAIRRALADSGVDPRHVSYVETHGTGTRLGDPIEIAALNKAFHESTQDSEFCPIGSVKSNIGHCESAAGIAGLTKVLLQMRHQQLVPSLHSETVNPHLELHDSPFTISRSLRPWERPVIDGRTLPRIAGISSFGASGANAHMIVEEFPQPPQQTLSLATVVILLSARTAEQLQQKAHDLLEFVRAQGSTIDLAATAYTLQVGREGMDERLGFVVSSVEQLIERLQAYLAGDQEIEDAHRGQVRRNKEALSLFGTDTDLQQAIDRWIANRKLSKLVELWVKGLEVDWSRLYDDARPRRISLPTYPFAREHYWIDVAGTAVAARNAAASILHPLLHSNTSDLSQQCYRSTFTGSEFFLADHQVATNGHAAQKVLPGAAYLEMARAAIEQASPAQPESTILELHDVVWAHATLAGEVRQISVALFANDNDEIEYEIYSKGTAQDTDQEIVLCEGRAVLSSEPAPARLDLEQLAAEMGLGRVEARSVYGARARTGLVYGPSLQGITAIHGGRGQLMARLQLPTNVEHTSGDYVLHPSLMEGALQACVWLIDSSSEHSSEPRLPVALDSLRIVAPCTREMVAWARYSPGNEATDNVIKLDADLCDEEGNVRAQMRGLSTRVLRNEISTTAAPAQAIGNLLATSVWQATADEASADISDLEFGEHHVILCELPEVDARKLASLLPHSHSLSLQAEQQSNIAQRYTEYALACFERVQAVLRGKPRGKVLMQVAVAGDQEQALFAGLSGLLKTAALENPQIIGQLILVPAATTAEELSRHLKDEKARGLGAMIRYEQGARQVLRWQEIPAGSETSPAAFRDGGVYLITGGLGALGVLFAQEILEQTQEARVLLTGRSPLSAEKRAHLDGLAAQHGRVSYRQMALDDLDQVRQVIAAIRDEHGQLNGILHTAGMIADNFILKKTGVEFTEVLAPKVTGTFNLDEATQDVELDFFVLFSSIAGAMGNPGQADYAAANGFMDQFAAYRNRLVAAERRYGRTRSINWPLWRAGGMALDPQTQELMQQTMGMQPMQTATGLSAFRRSLTCSCDQLLVVEGNVPKIESYLERVGIYSITDSRVPYQYANKAEEFYSDTIAQASTEFKEEYLTFAPFAQKKHGFSMSKVFLHPEQYPDEMQEVLSRQIEMRQVLFCDEDFGKLASVLDFGCGHGTDVIQIGKLFPHLHVHGCTITRDQALLGNQRISSLKLDQSRIRIHHQDSSKDPFPSSYDLAFGVEVSFHIRDKVALFSNICRSLSQDGRILLADYISDLQGSVDDPNVEISIPTQKEWARLTAQFQLEIDEIVDVSTEIANFLYDPDVKDNLGNLSEVSRRTFTNYANQSLSLDRGWLRYVLIKLKRNVEWGQEQLQSENLRKIQEPTPYRVALQAMLRRKQISYPPRTASPNASSFEAASETARDQRRPIRSVVATTTSGSASSDTDVVVSLSQLQQQVTLLLAAVLRIEPSIIDVDQPFSEFGLDSVLGIELMIAINKKYGTELSNIKVFDHPTVRELSSFLEHEIKTLPGHTRPPRVALATEPVVPVARSYRSPQRKARVSRSITRSQAPAADKIAIVGMSGRYAKANDLKEYWDNLVEGRNCIVEVPPSRWDVNRYYHPDPAVTGKTNSRWLGALDDVDCFDPLFFRISPQEAEYMDPQHRLFLQESYKAFEDAGYSGDALSSRKCGVYLGISTNEYASLLARHGVSSTPMTSNSFAIAAARIAYYLNLKGPAISVDTACSSSLVAIHLACQGLWSRETDMALAGGVGLWLTPESYLAMSQAGMLSSDGQCKTFDDAADGIVVGDGVGALVLKRLQDAQEDNDFIYGVILGSGMNQDGRTNGITAPSVNSQIELERAIYAKYQIDPDTIGYVETHGTGTKLGDPIELEALATVFKEKTARKNYCALGAVKSNIGHTSAAAGVAGVQKVLQSMQHRTLVPTLNVTRESTRFDFANSPFYISRETKPWDIAPGSLRRAAVSSFGFSGTNAHLVIEEYPMPLEQAVPLGEQGPFVVPLSARTAQQLRQRSQDLLEFVRTAPQRVDLAAVAYTLQIGREAMDERVGFVVRSVDELTRKLEAYLNGESAIEDFHRGQLKRNESLGIISEDDDLKDAVVAQWIGERKLSKLLGLWVKGVELDWSKLYDEIRPRRIPLPTYPFARDRHWIDVAANGHVTAEGASVAVVHPLLHRNTSDLSGQRYSSTFTGEEFFLTDHRVRSGGRTLQKVLPGVAYLEMARAAMEQASPDRQTPGILELQNTLWLKPLVVTERKQVSITLSMSDDDQVDFEISGIAGDEETIHCQGQATFASHVAPNRVDLERLRGQMKRGRLEASDIYALFDQMGIIYGSAHQGIAAIELGERQLVAELRLPAVVEVGRHEYVMHPSLMDSALQASIGLLVGEDRIFDKPRVPFLLESLRAFSACTPEMFAWVRYSAGSAEGAAGKVDIDVCDQQGNVCIQMRGFATRDMESQDGSPTAISTNLHINEQESPFDRDFYEKLVADIASHEVTVDEAVTLG